jgi:DNA polymerase III subunit epsilon
VVTERSAHTDAVSHLVFDRWCHLGSADSSVALAALLAAPPPRAFSLDLWRLFSRWLAQPGNETRVEAV